MDAYDKGYAARMEGKGVDENPYDTFENVPEDEQGYKYDWIEGWQDADREFCSATRTIGY